MLSQPSAHTCAEAAVVLLGSNPDDAASSTRQHQQPQRRAPGDLVADTTSFIMDEDCRPWPCIGDFSLHDVTVGSCGAFAWIASGSRALLWHVDSNEFVKLRETDDAVTDILVHSVASEHALWWVFLISVDQVTWLSLDGDCGRVEYIGAARVPGVAKLRSVGGCTVAITDAGDVTMLVPDVAAGSIKVVASQSWGQWVSSWVSRPKLIDTAVIEESGVLVTLDTKSTLAAWSVQRGERPSKLWSTTIELGFSVVGIFATTEFISLVCRGGARYSVATNPQPGSTTKPVSCGEFAVSNVGFVRRSGSITTVTDVDTMQTLVAVEGPLVAAGTSEKRDAYTIVRAHTDDVATSITFMEQAYATVTLIGHKGVCRVRVLCPALAAARLVSTQPSALGQLSGAFDGSVAAASKLIEAVRMLRRFPLLAPHCGPEDRIAQALDALSVPGMNSEGVSLSATATALMEATRSAFAPLCLSENIVSDLRSAESEALDELCVAIQEARELIASTAEAGGWLDSTNCDRLASDSWSINPAMPRAGGAGPVVVRVQSSRVTDSAAIGVQADLLSCAALTLERAHTVVALMRHINLQCGREPAPEALRGAALVPQAGDEAVVRVLTWMCRLLCESSREGAAVVAAALDYVPAQVRTEATAWELAWEASDRDAAQSFTLTHSYDLWLTGGLDALSRKLFDTPATTLDLLGSLYQQASASRDADGKNHVKDELVALLSRYQADVTVIETLATKTWAELPSALHKEVGSWLLEKERGADGMQFARLFARAPSTAVEHIIRVPSAGVATYLRAAGDTARAVDTYIQVAVMDGTSIARRRECVDAAQEVGPTPEQAQVLGELRERVKLQEEVLNLVANGVATDSEPGLAEGHLLMLDGTLLEVPDLYSAAREYRSVGGAMIEIKLLARQQTAEERAWADAIDAAVEFTIDPDLKPAQQCARVIAVCEQVVREAKSCDAAHLPMHFVVSVLEALCSQDPHRLRSLKSAGASVDELFNAYLMLLEDSRVLVYHSLVLNPTALLLTMSSFVLQAMDAVPADQAKRILTAVEVRVKRLHAIARVNMREVAESDMENLNTALGILAECEDSAAGRGMGATMGSQSSWVF